MPAVSLQHALGVAAAAGLVLLGAGCDGDDAPATTTTTGRPPPSTTTTPAAADPCEVTGTDVVRATPQQGPLFLTDVLHAAKPPCERVSFVFEDVPDGAAVGYEVGYAGGPFADPSGQAVPVEGDAFLRIVLLNGTTVDLSGEVPRESDIDPEVDPATRAVVDIVQVSDFEGQSEWVVGLRERVPFRVFFDGGASDRLVLELATGSPG